MRPRGGRWKRRRRTSRACWRRGEERLQQALNDNPDLPVEELLPKIKRSIDTFVGDADQFDDITMLGLSYKGV